MNELNKLIKKGNVLVYFYADWCSKCKILSLELAKIDDLNIVKVDADKNRNICKKYGVMSLPTLIYFKKNGTYNKVSGLINIEEIINLTKK